MAVTGPSLYFLSLLFFSLLCSGWHFDQNNRHHHHARHQADIHSFSKRQNASNSSQVDSNLQPLPSENISFFENAPENFFMRQPWSAENVTEATFRQKFAPALDLVTTTAATSNDYTCSASKPCRGNAACCNGVTGQCGFGPKYCGADVCISDCQSKAECGEFAAEGKEQCPLKVCCSEFGFCGTTSEFCGKGCQNNCGDPKPSGRRAKNPQSRVIAYYEAWSPSKACGNMEPEDIPVEGLTHLNFAFGYVSPNTYNIVPMDSRTPEELFTRVTSAKERNTKLKVFVALGGWTFSDNGTDTQAVFPTMVKTRPARSRFINNLISFLSQYGFDGVDIDWEYPSAGDRGGTPDDTKNFVLLMQEMRSAFDSEGKGWGITFTVPTSYWYLRWFDVPGMAKYVDWINVMSYDLHGVWDKTNPIGSIINPHTNLTEIDDALKLLWRVGIEPEKIVLGVAFYGRSFQLADSSCTGPSCPFAGPAAKGICTGEEGILSYMEIQNILQRTKAKATYDKTAGVQYVVFNGNQWVSYDDAKTIQQKVDFARDKGLSGLMTWAIDLDDSKSTLLKTMVGKSFDTSKWSNKALAMTSEASNSLSSKCTVTECHKMGEMSCPNGYLFQTYMDGPGYIYADSMKCPTGKQRSLCCPADHNPDRSQCKWSSCGWPCDKGETFITNDWVGDNPNKACSPRTGSNFRNYCCRVDNMKQYYESCQWTACGKDPKCGQGNQKDFTEDLITGYSWTEGLPNLCPSEFCQFSEQCNQKKAKFCCKPKKVSSCKWRGTPNAAGISNSRDTCYDNECLSGEIVFDRATAGDDPENPCFMTSPKVLCCKPGEDADANFDIDPAHLVPQDLREGSDIEVGSHVSADSPKTEDFFTFMSVIGNKQDVVSLDKRDGSHLEFFGCSPGTGRQTAKVVCSNTTESSNCNDIHDGGLWGTVVRLPEGCGRSRWARAISLSEAADQTLPGHLKKRGMPSGAKVQELTFDYDFKNLKRASSKIAFRIDQANLGNYWANVVDSAAKRDDASVDYREREELREFFANQTDESGLHEKIPYQLYSHHYNKRWYGDDAGDFAQKATKGDAGGLSGAFDVTLTDFGYGVHGELQCQYGGSKYTAVADITTVGKVTGKIKYGATMYGELWPNFSFRKSYIHMRGSLKGDFALDVTSDNVWDYQSDNMEFLKQFNIPGTSYEIDGIGEIYLYAGARGKAYAKGEWSGNINIPWKWQTDVVTLTVPSNSKVEDAADFEKDGMGAGASITPRYALGNDKLQMTVSIKPYIGLGFGVGAGDPKKKSSSFGTVAGLEMETEIRSIFQVSHNSELKESCINIYGQVGVNGVAVSPLAGWLLGKDRTEYALYHSNLVEIHKNCFPTGEIGKRSLPRGLSIAPGNQIDAGTSTKSEDHSVLAKRAKDMTCRSDKAKAESDTDCSKCLIDNGFASDLSPPDQVYDTDLCDVTKRSSDEQPRPKMAIFLRNETTITNATAHAHLDKRAVTISKIDKCRLQWTSAKYDSCQAFQKKMNKYYYDEYSQTSCTDFRTYPYSKSQRSAKGQYATEHVFELNFIKEFLEFLRNQVYHDEVKESTVYKGFSCSDLTDTFFLGATGSRNIDLVMNELGNRDKTDRLAVLFKDINGMKFRALARDGKASIVSQSTWDKSTWREKYSLLKRAGGVAHYMLTSEISKMFVDTSNGVYDAMGKADGNRGWKLSARYALWMDHLIKAYNEGLKDFVQKRSQELYDAHQAGSATGYTTSEVNNLQRMAQNGNPNFNMWWSPSGLKK